MKVAIAWYGLPYYGAKVIAMARIMYPHAEFIIIATPVGIPYEGIDGVSGGRVRWVDSTKPMTWVELGEAIPDVFILTSWCHVAYMALARQAKLDKGTLVVSMVDNYFCSSLKQWLGAVYFRIKLRQLFDWMWVPGKRGAHFMKFLGMPSARIMTGLYSADPEIFYPPAAESKREGVVFVGQLIERKGMEEIIHILQSREGYKYKRSMRIIGHGALAKKLEDLDLPVEAFKQPTDLRGVYQSASALLLPSQMDHWGVVAHEAALCGGIILATRQCGCVDDLVEHKVNGYILEESSVSEIMKALAWHETLSVDQIKIARNVSIEKAGQFSPKKWAENLDKMVPLLQMCR